MNSLLKHALAVFGLVGSMIALMNLQTCENEQPRVAKAQEIDADTYSTTESEEYKDLSRYLDSVSIEYEINASVEDFKDTLENLSDEQVEELYLDVVSTTEGNATFDEVIRIQASTFGEAFASARYQLGPNQEWVWEANGVTYTTNFAEEENTGATHTPDHFWTDAEINSGAVIDTTQAPY